MKKYCLKQQKEESANVVNELSARRSFRRLSIHTTESTESRKLAMKSLKNFKPNVTRGWQIQKFIVLSHLIGNGQENNVMNMTKMGK